jgi:hypothetical protein
MRTGGLRLIWSNPKTSSDPSLLVLSAVSHLVTLDRLYLSEFSRYEAAF